MALMWNRCLICTTRLNDKGNKKVDSVERLLTVKRTCFLKYVLGIASSISPTPATGGDSLFNDVLQLLPPSLSEDSSVTGEPEVRLCMDCNRRAEQVSALHSAIEVAQMKILSILEGVKDTCRWVAEYDGFQFQKEVSNLKQQLEGDGIIGRGDEGGGEMQRLLKILTEVQTSVLHKEIRPQTIFSCYSPPRIILERCTSLQQMKNHHAHATKYIVKKEPDQDLDYSGDESYHDNYDNFHNSDDTRDEQLEHVEETRFTRKRGITWGQITSTAKRSKVLNLESEPGDSNAVSKAKVIPEAVAENTETKTGLPTGTTELSQPPVAITRRSKKRRKRGQRLSASTSLRSKTKVANAGKILIDADPTPADKLLRKLKATHSQIYALQKTSSSFTCHTCGYKTLLSFAFDQHLRQHETDEKTFHCPENSCDRSYTNIQFFMFHLQQHCTRKRKCPRCDENLPVLQMEKHLKTHFGQLFPCESCDFSFGSFIDLLKHCRRHSDVNMRCQLCTEPELVSKRYSGRIDVLTHLYEDHKMEDIIIKCDYPDCNKTFFDQYSKQSHEKVHKNLVTSTCTICLKVFSCKTVLRKHLSRFHKSESQSSESGISPQQDSSTQPSSESIRSETEQLLLKIKAETSSVEIFHSLKHESFNCLICEFKTEVPSKMDQHLREHETDTKSFHCPDANCKRSFTHKQHFVFHLQQHCTRKRWCLSCDEHLPVLQMEEHLKTHFEKLFFCESCDFSFGNFPDLVHHNRFHPRVELKCQLCTKPKLAKQLYRRNDIRKHLYEHHKMEELLLTCDFPGCAETFFDPNKKQAHANVHKKRFMCQACSKSFPNYSTLTKHVSVIHRRQKQLLKTIKAAQRRRGSVKSAAKAVMKKQRAEAEKTLLQMEAKEQYKELFKSLKPNEFVCIICGQKAQKAWLVEQHLREHETDEKFFHCPEESCTRSFTNKQLYVFHLQNHCVRKRKCDSCNAHFPVMELLEHLKTHHERVFTCQLCDYSFGTFKDLLSHGRYHSKADLLCQLCTEPETAWQHYPTRQLLLEHLYNYHNMEDLLIKCDDPDCKETFLDPFPKKIHMSKAHPPEGVVKPGCERAKKESRPRTPRQKQECLIEKSATDTTVQLSEAEKLLLNLEAEESSYAIFRAFKYQSYDCIKCNYSTARAFVMDQHLREHEQEETEEKSFHCPETNCNKSFAHKQSFIFHLQQHTTRKTKCNYCEEFIPVLQLEGHLRVHYDQIYSCQLCDYWFGSFKDYVAHVRHHKKAALKCQLCTESELSSQMYPSYSLLLQHLYEYHKTTDALLKCDYPDCKETFFSYRLKQGHNSLHKEVHKCDSCPKSFSSSSSLSNHRKIHTNEKNVLCDQCPEGFRTKAVLDAHKISVHGKQPYKCKLCVDISKEFATKAGLDSHVSSFHENKRWKCSTCGKELCTKAGWITHMQTHSTQKNFQCQTCGHATNTLAALKRHQKLHGEKKFVCSYCPKAFTIKRYLNEHTLTHTKEQPFVCDLCGSRFNQRYSLSFHKKKKHGVVRNSGSGDIGHLDDDSNEASNDDGGRKEEMKDYE